MKCAGCSREAEFMLHEHNEPHCKFHFAEAIDGCTTYTLVMTVDGYEAMMRLRKQSQKEAS